jgi:hypothetical protein
VTSRASGPGSAGQATVELVALLPLVVLVAVAAVQLLAAGAARELAAHAAQAGAMALLQGEDPEDEARAAIPGWSRARATVRVDGRRVTVRLRPPALLDELAELLATTRTADAGPSPAGAASYPGPADAATSMDAPTPGRAVA